MSLKKQIFILLASLVLVAPVTAQARGLVPCGGYKDNGSLERPCNIEDIFILIARATNFLIAMAGVVAVYYIVAGGFWLIVSTGNEEDISKRKSQISSAVVGFVLVLMAFMFVNTVVNFLLSRSIVTDPKGQGKATTACKFDLTSPLTYLTIDPKKCSSLPEATLHKP